MESSPAPTDRFWDIWKLEAKVRGRTTRLSLQADENRPPRTVVSPVDVTRIYPESYVSYSATSITNAC